MIESRIRTYRELPIVKLVEHKFSRGFSYSYGIIPYCRATRRWFLVRRKHNYVYLRVIWGDYSPATLKNTIFSLSDDDVDIITQCLTDFEFYKEKYNETVETVIPEKIEQAYKRLRNNEDIITKLLFLRSSSTQKNTEWTWTKGMKETYDLTSFDAAIREFKEESGIDSVPAYTILSDEITTSHINSNREYFNIFWVCAFETEFKPMINSSIEVHEGCWFTTEEVKKIISPLYIESFEQALKLVLN